MRRLEFLAGVAIVVLAAPGAVSSRVLRLDALPLGNDIDPYRNAVIGVDELAWLYGDGLTGWDGRPVPLLAARLPEESDGGKRYRYQLRRATWHDGRRVVARDIAAALAMVRATTWATREPYRSIRELIIAGDNEFDVVLDSPQRGFVRSFFGACASPALPVLRRATNLTPLGTGPFAVRARPELQRWRLDRWPGSPRGIPQLDAIELRILSSDITAGVQLQSGETDIALPLAPAATRSDRFERVRRYTSVAVLLFNTGGIFRDAAIRRSFAAAADVPALQRAYDHERTTIFASILLGGDADPAFARALTFDAHAGAALRAKVGDRELVIAYVRESAAHERTALLLQQTLHAAGVGSVLRPAPAALYFTEDGPLRTGHFDVAIDAFKYGEDPQLAPDWGCEYRPPAGGNFARFCDPAFEAAAAGNDTSSELRRLYEATAFVPLTRSYEEIGVSRRVIGFAAPLPSTPATYGCVAWRVT